MAWDRNVVAHELSHSWDGKYRRPAGLWTPDYRQPMQDNLLWVYEGQDQFWGWVLAARSGLQPKDIVLGALANSAGLYSVQPGRAWRSVEDTTFDPIIDARRPQPYAVAQPQRGLLLRRHAGLARGRPDHPRRHRRRARASTISPGRSSA